MTITTKSARAAFAMLRDFDPNAARLYEALENRSCFVNDAEEIERYCDEASTACEVANEQWRTVDAFNWMEAAE